MLYKVLDESISMKFGDDLQKCPQDPQRGASKLKKQQVDSLMMGTDCLLAGHAFCVTVLALVKKHVYGLIVLVKKYSPGTS